MSEEVKEQQPNNVDYGAIKIGLRYDEKLFLFFLDFVRVKTGEKVEEIVLFSSKFDQENFEQLTAGMLKLIKDVNLKQAQTYTEKVNNEAAKAQKVQMENGTSQSQGPEGSPEQSTNSDEAQPCGTPEVV